MYKLTILERSLHYLMIIPRIYCVLKIFYFKLAAGLFLFKVVICGKYINLIKITKI